MFYKHCAPKTWPHITFKEINQKQMRTTLPTNDNCFTLFNGWEKIKLLESVLSDRRIEHALHVHVPGPVITMIHVTIHKYKL